MEVTFNLNDPLPDSPGGSAPTPPGPPNIKPEPKKPAGGKRLVLPLIGKRPVRFQMEVLATAFLIFLVFAGYVGVMDARTAANRVAHLAIAGEMSALIERIVHQVSSPSAGTTSPEWQVARTRESKLLDLLDNGGEMDGKSIPPADGTLSVTLDDVRTRWAAFDRALQAMTRDASPEAIKSVNDAYPAVRDAHARLHLTARDALKQSARDRALIAGLGSLAMLMLVLFFKIFNDDSVARQAALEQQKREAEEANARTQAAISQLMDEMTNVADGDLTSRASVGDNITGTIADAMNYAVEELAVLVKRINDASHRVATSSNLAAKTSVELLDATEVQSKEIRQAGGQVLSMAQSMNEVSGKAAQSVGVAQQSLDAATKGATAVADSIRGMDGIRGQIQETSKRIKRLGESSQEIGEIVELITDITEQTTGTECCDTSGFRWRGRARVHRGGGRGATPCRAFGGCNKAHCRTGESHTCGYARSCVGDGKFNSGRD